MTLYFRAEHNREVLEDLLKQEKAEDDCPDFSEDSDEDEATEISNDPLWKVYWLVRNHCDPSYPDMPLADVFCHLPSRK